MFNRLIGNEKIKQDLQKAIVNHKVSHSYLFAGTEGIGKMLFAKEFAKAILCEQEQGDKPCGKCKSCLEFEHNNHPDFYHVNVGDEKSIKIETIRKLQEKVQELPIVSGRKVYVIENAETMTTEAQNCLLKTIEEPPAFVHIILTTSNENKILSTILSRCIKLYFQNIKDDVLKQYLAEQYHITNVSENNIKAYHGSIGKALQIENNKELYSSIERVFGQLENYTLPMAMKELAVLYKEKDFAEELLDYINVILLGKAKQNAKYIEYIEKVEDVKRKIRGNANYTMAIDSLLFKIYE